MVPEPEVHEWVSFVDEGVTWLFDVTFLTSNWTCVWGTGCPGVRSEAAPELHEGCCSHGAHFTDEGDQQRVRAHAAELSSDRWQHRVDDVGDAFTIDDDGASVTVLVDDACIFLNRPGFSGGAGCALHLEAESRHESPIDWKPDVCWQLPLRLEEQVDDNDNVTMILRQWDRRDWGAGGAEFHWWCTESDLAFAGHVPVYQAMREEIVELVGQRAYRLLTDHLDARPATGLLPHPALRSAHPAGD